ncbi:MAG: hypothetical protein JWO69_1483 [Thermoleophilia bacterium]|jgi:hypothetical protein|nr:hypothetical protein [Thermoleophilia bacterium]
MQCYYHSESSAVGVCKNCQRGVCRGCAAEVPNGIACGGRCEQQATSIGRTMNESAHSILIMGFVFIAMGLMFAALGAVNWYRYGDPEVFPLAMGGLFVLSGVVLIVRWLMTRRAARTGNQAASSEA